jgi:hypothetical protein
MARRSAREWADLVREFERSGETAASFAAKRGIRKDTFVWWRWRLGRAIRVLNPATEKRKRGTRVQLVAVEPVSEGRSAADCGSEALAWELVSPSGHILRVYQRDGLDVLRAALAAVARGRRR